jgi:hypothetical protein
MARSVRINYPSAFYLVMTRGNRREAFYLEGDDPVCLGRPSQERAG